MILTVAGFLVSLVFLVTGLHTGDPFLLIGSLVIFGLAIGSIDIVAERRYERASDELNHTGAYRVGYERKDRAA